MLAAGNQLLLCVVPGREVGSLSVGEEGGRGQRCKLRQENSQQRQIKGELKDKAMGYLFGTGEHFLQWLCCLQKRNCVRAVNNS